MGVSCKRARVERCRRRVSEGEKECPRIWLAQARARIWLTSTCVDWRRPKSELTLLLFLRIVRSVLL